LQGDGDKSMESDRVVDNSNEISMEDEATHGTGFLPYYRIPTSKWKAACDWVENFHLVERKSEMNQLGNYIAKARLNGLQVLSDRIPNDMRNNTCDHKVEHTNLVLPSGCIFY